MTEQIKLQTKKIIAISGSPSKGRNSDSMLDAFISGMRESSEKIEVEKFYITDIPIDSYRFENGTGTLLHEKAFTELCEKIKNANGLIIATPTYNFSVPSDLKNFIDRIRFISMDLTQRNRFGQPIGMLGHLSTYFLVSGGTPKWAQKILFFAFPPFWLRAVFLYYGAKCIGAFYSGDLKTFENKKVLDKCKKRGARFAQSVIHERGNGILERIFWRPPLK